MKTDDFAKDEAMMGIIEELVRAKNEELIKSKKAA